jgi:hypothetical protein
MDPCLLNGGVCGPQAVGIEPEGFAVDVEDVQERRAPQ